MPRKKFVAGNWKMNTTAGRGEGAGRGGREGRRRRTARRRSRVCPPFPWLTAVARRAEGHAGRARGAELPLREGRGVHRRGAARQMLVDAGCKYVIVGHSERRHGLGETDDAPQQEGQSRARGRAAGHPLRRRDCSPSEKRNRTEARVCQRQVDRRAAPGSPPSSSAKLVIAYEPVWAIGTGQGRHAGAGAGRPRLHPQESGRTVRREGRRCASHPVRRVA